MTKQRLLTVLLESLVPEKQDVLRAALVDDWAVRFLFHAAASVPDDERAMQFLAATALVALAEANALCRDTLVRLGVATPGEAFVLYAKGPPQPEPGAP